MQEIRRKEAYLLLERALNAGRSGFVASAESLGIEEFHFVGRRFRESLRMFFRRERSISSAESKGP